MTVLFIPNSLASLNLTDEEIAWLSEGQKVKVAVHTDHYPYIYLDDRGEYRGMIKDYLQYIEKMTGIEFVEVAIGNLQTTYQDIEKGIIDIYPITLGFDGDDKDIAYSIPYLAYTHYYFVNTSIANRTNREQEGALQSSVGAREDSVVARYIKNHQLPLNLITYASNRNALLALDSGQIQSFIGDKFSSSYLIQKLNLNNIRAFKPFSELYGNKMQMAMSRDATLLLSIINKSLSNIPSELENDIMAYWSEHQAFQNQLNGYFDFNRPPYLFSENSRFGLEFSLLQHLFESMGYEIGKFVSIEEQGTPAAVLPNDEIDFTATQTNGIIESSARSSHQMYYSAPYYTQEFRLITREGEKIEFSVDGNEIASDKKVGAVTKKYDLPSKEAISLLFTRFNKELDSEYSDINTALTALYNNEIDYLLIDYLELDSHQNKQLNPIAIDTTHAYQTRFDVPLHIGFKDKRLRDNFNAELALFLDSAKYQRLENLYKSANFQLKGERTELMTEIISYLVREERLALLDRVLDAFSFGDAFTAITLNINDGRETRRHYKNDRGRMLRVGNFNRQGLVYLENPLSFDNESLKQVSGSLIIYSELGDNLAFNQSYIPPLSFFESWSENDFEQIRQIYLRLGLNAETLNLSLAELNWIADNPVVKVGVDPVLMPYEGLHNGEYQGIIANILTEIGKTTGITFEPVLVDDWADTIELFENRSVPMVSAPMENESLSLDYVENLPLLTDQLSLVARRGEMYAGGLESFEGKKVGIQEDAANTSKLGEIYPNIDWTPVESANIGLQLLNRGALEGYIDASLVINYVFNQYQNRYNDLLIVENLDFRITPTFHILKSEPILGAIVTKALRSISSSQKQQLMNPWTSNRIIETVDYTAFIYFSVFFVTIVTVLYVSNRKLKKQVLETKKAQMEALESRNKLFEILDTSSIAAVIMQNGVAVYTNKRANEQFKLQDHPTEGYMIDRIYLDPQVRREVFQGLERTGEVVGREIEFGLEDGSTITAVCSYYQIEYDGESAVLFWSYDVTEIKQLNLELADAIVAANVANQTKSDFLARMSHEIRTPMNAIIGMSYLALEDQLSHKTRNYLSKVYQSAQSLLLIINDILDLSKIESGKLELEQRSYSLKTMMKNVANVLSFNLVQKSVDFLFVVDRNVPEMVIGDQLRLSQVLINLGNNATKFTQSGEVSIGLEAKPSLTHSGDYVYHFYVQDTGVGIPSDKIESLFDSFQQADVSTTREYGGTGLGLTISRQIIELMGGHIWVDSEVGGGSTFHFEVEMSVIDSAVSQQHQALLASSVFNSKTFFFLESSTSGTLAIDRAIAGLPMKSIVTLCYDELMDQLSHDEPESERVIYVADKALDERSIKLKEQLDRLTQFGRVVFCSSDEDKLAIATTMSIDVLSRPWLPFELIHGLVDSQGVNIQHDVQSPSNVTTQLFGTRVLLAEDNELNQELVIGLLEPYGIDIDVVSNGLLAVERAQKSDYALILMDINMPVLGGYEATQRIRQFNQQIPIVAMTANVMVDEEQKAAQVGMDDYLPKPIDPSRLLMVINNAAKIQRNLADKRASMASNSLTELRLEGADEDQHLFSPAQGLVTCGGDESLYLRLLGKYVKNSQVRLHSFNQALNESNWEAAQREMHTLKGTSASIGAEALATLSASYEQQLSQEQSTLTQLQKDRLESLLEQTQALVNEYIECYSHREAADTDMSQRVIAEPDVASVSLDNLMLELRELIENYDLQSVDKVQMLLQGELPKNFRGKLMLLERALSSYQFENALKIVNELIEPPSIN